MKVIPPNVFKLKKIWGSVVIFLLPLWLYANGCASLHHVSKVSKTTIDKVLLSVGLRMKRETKEFACDSYFAYFRPNFSEPLLSQTLKCLNGIKDGSATYSYQFVPQPHLDFKDSSKSAECMKNVFPIMSLPKELYFVAQSEVRTEWECYAVNMDTEVGVVADIKLPWDRFKLEIKFPLSRELKTQSDLQIWLMVNLLESIKAEMGGTLKGSMVTESLCKRCYQDTPWFDDKRKDKIPAIYWP